MQGVENSIKGQALVGLGNARYVGHDRGSREDWYFEVLKMPGVENSIKSQALVGLGNARYVGHGKGKDIDWYLEVLKMPGVAPDLKLGAYTGLANAAGADRRNQDAVDWLDEAMKMPLSMNQKDKIKQQRARFKHFVDMDRQSGKGSRGCDQAGSTNRGRGRCRGGFFGRSGKGRGSPASHARS